MYESTRWVVDVLSSEADFREEAASLPELDAHQLLLKVAATSVNPIDTKMRAGLVPAISPATPAVLHGDVSGTVIAVGDAVTLFSEGDEVYGCAGGVEGIPGALCTHMVVHENFIAKRPRNISLVESAALPLVSITAWQGLFEKAQISADQSVLVFGGTGGVGHVAAQLAQSTGAKVVTTVGSEEKAQLARELGLDVILRHEEEAQAYNDRITGGAGFDCVFDTVGQQNLDLSFQLAREQGKVIAIAARSTHDLSPLHRKGLSLHVVFMLTDLLNHNFATNHGKILAEVTALVEAEKVKPLIHKTVFNTREILAAHQCVERGEAIGKVLIQIEQ